MGPNSEKRVVQKLVRGQDEMVNIIPNKGDSFVINMNHVLYLTRSNGCLQNLPQSMEISVKEYLQKGSDFKNRYGLTKTSIDFSNNVELPIPAYILGVWLGDGTSSNTAITTMDLEIHEEYHDYCRKMGLEVRLTSKGIKNKAYSLKGSTESLNTRNRPNIFLNFLNDLNLINNKHIPSMYKTSSRRERLEL